MSENLPALSFPELIIGVAGPIGTDMESLCIEITGALKAVRYEAHPIQVTEFMTAYPAPGVSSNGSDYFSQMMYKMEYGNSLCSINDDPAYLMRIAMQQIGFQREKIIARKFPLKGSEDRPRIAPSIAYIIRQLKRPEEVNLLRKVYGKQFILISAYGSEEHRRARLTDKIRDSLEISTRSEDIAFKTEKALARDQDEGSDENGQHLRATYHLADVFVDGINKDQMRAGLDRFFEAFFGKNDIGPSKVEYGMYAAKAASLRSTDLSRQVGSAIFNADGDLISQGCNEVPRAFGGTYWADDEPDYRDVKLGYDPNDHLKKGVIRDLMERLSKAGFLSDEHKKFDDFEKLVDFLIGRDKSKQDEHNFACLKNSQVNDLTEYGRVVHAEMVAICDAARLGKKIKNSILFVTTFPCHNCTKHIIASGIRSVTFMEPYPKSRAKQLHKNEIEVEKTSETKVSFLPFLGISPYRYRDIFEKSSRKSDGKANDWYDSQGPRPMLSISVPAYLTIEPLEVTKLGGSIQKKLL